MQSATKTSWVVPALLCVSAVTLARVYAIWARPTDLFVDEAQYWLWGQELAFGYYSKPPMIGWIIRIFTGLGPTDPFWVRLPAPLFHGATALLLAWVAKLIWDARTAFWAAITYITLPLVAVGSFLISTDTIMFPFLVLALGSYLKTHEATGFAWPLLAGVSLGIAALSKYAALYYIGCAVLVLLCVPSWRLRWPQIAMIFAAFLVAFSPNVLWNMANGFSTAEHTLDNVDWVRDPGERANFDIASLAEFVGSQFIVFGPVLFALLLWLAASGVLRRTAPVQNALLLLSIPILLVVCTQSILSEAYANWAVAAYLAGTLLVAAWLMDHPRLRIVSLCINGTFSLVLIFATLTADSLSLDGERKVMARYLGMNAMSEAIFAASNGLPILASNRDILANLFFLKGNDHQVYAIPSRGRAKHHYQLSFAYSGGDASVAVVRRSHSTLPCPADILLEITPTSGHYRGQSFTVYRAPGTCFDP